MESFLKGFRIYFTPKDEWHTIVTESWFGHQPPFTVDTSPKSFPLEVSVYPLLREYSYPLLSEMAVENSNMDLSSENCFKPDMIVDLCNAGNCTEACIPIFLRSLFDTSDVSFMICV